MDFEKMREVIAETVGCDLEKVTREAELEADLGADSLAAMELVMALEEAFDIEVDDSAPRPVQDRSATWPITSLKRRP